MRESTASFCRSRKWTMSTISIPTSARNVLVPLILIRPMKPPTPFRHQVFEIPEIKPVKTEFRCHEIECTCGHKTRAPLPPHVAESTFGPRAHATIGYLTSSHLGTRRGVTEIMSTLFGIDISLGSTCNAPRSSELRDRARGRGDPTDSAPGEILSMRMRPAGN